jgi:hypothetical protein
MKKYVDMLLDKAEKAFLEEDGVAFLEVVDTFKRYRGQLDSLPALPDLTWTPNVGKLPSLMLSNTFDVVQRNGTITRAHMNSNEFRWTIHGSSGDIVGYRKVGG